MLADVPADSSALPALRFYALESAQLAALETELQTDEAQLKRDWYAFNGGVASTKAGSGDHKPLFFDIALNYVNLPMDKLLERAGKAPIPATTPTPKAAPKALEKEDTSPQSPETADASASRSGGLSSLLGGWWGRK